ncbi:PREDICTED: 28S ribosomal protein S18b, mitochondrial [Eufriesea mexicana]|uniref:28S ribosomal protein S18b, mitochondrial n=1 Tax=Eufriesea mexicana TaxID=516756 RepID=UPI00083BE112|nr:PREDICTED: 28S ribosomal protein S18b, mitochondrial [Eufriesea mexicana]
MSLILNKLQLTVFFRPILNIKVIPVKFIHHTSAKYEIKEDTSHDPTPLLNDESISVETSMKYLKSSAYKICYGEDPVWKYYKRNFKGQFPSRKTRKTCIRGNKIDTGSPCPICRDKYLILDYRNIDLLKQFISEHNGEILSYNYTNLCQKAHKNLLVAITKAKEYGLITYSVPFRYYDYSEWKS